MDELFNWSDSFNTGIVAIDEQHKGIVDLINKLHKAIQIEDNQSVSDVLSGLISYTASHFSFEEEMLKNQKYPSFEAHKKKHDAFIARINHYKHQFENGDDIAKKLSSELILWLTTHIKQEDMNYISYCDKPIKKGLLNKMIGKYFKK